MIKIHFRDKFDFKIVLFSNIVNNVSVIDDINFNQIFKQRLTYMVTA